MPGKRGAERERGAEPYGVWGPKASSFSTSAALRCQGDPDEVTQSLDPECSPSPLVPSQPM